MRVCRQSAEPGPRPWRENSENPITKNYLKLCPREYRTHRVYPPADDIFNAFHLTPLEQVKAVILGRILITGRARPRACAFPYGPE